MIIKFLPNQPHCFSFGGFDLQVLNTIKALKKLGVDAEKLDIWDRSNDFDILHCWGLDISHYNNIHYGKLAGKKIVLTALLGYNEDFKSILKWNVSKIIGKARFLDSILRKIDALVVLNNLQSEIAVKHLGIPKEKIYVIPAIINDRYFSEECESNFLKGSYVLITGNICLRKNQVNLAKACIKNKLDLVIIGNVLSGEEEYAKELEELCSNNKNITWIKGLQDASKELISYYKDCSVFALPSYDELQPASALEAAALKKPLLLANRKYAKQKYFNNAKLINPSNIDDIAKGLSEILINPHLYVPPQENLIECKPESVAKAHIKMYKEILYYK